MDDAFQWVPFYEALADSLLSYKNKRGELFDLIKKTSSGQPLMQYLNFHREDWWGPRQHQIDPFSVIGILNRGQMTYPNRTGLANILGDIFGVSLPAPTQFDGIPVLNPLKSFFAGVDGVWELFIAAMGVAETGKFTDEFKIAFERATAVKDNGVASITMGLYWIRPNVFMPLDKNSRMFISGRYGIEMPSSACSGDEYVSFLNSLNNKISQLTPNVTLPELSHTAWEQNENYVDEKKQRAAFKKWYANNGGSPNSANTVSSAIGKAKLKNGRSIFSIATFDILDSAIRNSGLEGYFQTKGGDYSKMNAVFDMDDSVQEDDLKSGIKYYLSFLESLGTVQQQSEYIEVTPKEAKIIDIDLSDRVLLDEIHHRLKEWTYGRNIEFKRIYNIYETGLPNFIDDEQRVEYLQLLRQIKTVCGGEKIPYTRIYNILTSDTRGIEARKGYNYLNGWVGLSRPLEGKGNNSAFNHIIETHKDYIFNSTIPEKGSGMTKGDFPPKSPNKNIILYGPPGTGKTYSSIQYAVAIIERKPLAAVKMENYDAVFSRYQKYKDDGLIAFTTFHQSFGYEEFIEGIRPVMSSEENTEAGQDIEYEIRDGIFKAFCDKSWAPVGDDTSVDLGINKNPTIWKVSLEGTGDNPTRTECMEKGYIRIGWAKYGEKISDATDYSENGGKAVLNAFYNRMQLGDIVLSCYSSKTIDAIGVIIGEPEWDDNAQHYKRLRKVRWLAKGINEDITDLNSGKSMTLSTIYKLAIPVADVLQILRKVNPTLFPQEVKISNRVFIIDEINRGNISKIFGELITLIEPSKRIGAEEQLRTTLPYSGYNFGVPDNVYILATMNTADRSLARMDTALRRRFSFEPIYPDAESLPTKNIGRIDLVKMLTVINKRIASLYDKEHCIGHSYFWDVETLNDLAEVFKNKILPLLEEYFFEDLERLHLVLGNAPFFVKETIDPFLLGYAEEYRITPQWILNDDALKSEDTYIKTYDSPTSAESSRS